MAGVRDVTIGGSNQLICFIFKCELIGCQYAKHVGAQNEVRHLNANDDVLQLIAQFVWWE